MDENQEYIPGDSYMEEEQQMVTGDISSEVYDPSADDGMMPYIPSGQTQSPQQNYQPQGQAPMQGFIDLDQLGQQPQQNVQQNQQQQQYNPNQQYQQNLANMSMTPEGPNALSAHKNLEIMENAMGMVQDIASTTQKEGDSNRVYATDVALKSLHGAITALSEIEYWIPEGKEEYVSKLNQIAKPIVDALKNYTDTIERIK